MGTHPVRSEVRRWVDEPPQGLLEEELEPITAEQADLSALGADRSLSRVAREPEKSRGLVHEGEEAEQGADSYDLYQALASI